MLWPHQTIVRRDLFALPVAPATRCGYRLRQSPELLRPGHQPICFAVRVFRDAIAAQIGLFRPHLNKQHATAEQRPSSSRRARDSTTWLSVVVRMVSKSRRSAAATGRGSSSLVGTIWSESRRSSEMLRGQRDELRPSRRTNRLGDAASALAGIQHTDTQASRPSSCFIVSKLRSSDAAVPARSALRQIVSARPCRSVSPASSAASRPRDRSSTMRPSAEPWSVPSGQSPAVNLSIRRVHGSVEDKGASTGNMAVQPSGNA